MTNKFDHTHTNTNKKYVIRNCPCFFEENEEVYDYTCTWNGTEELACQDCTDCVLKQIVEKCKNAQSECSCEDANKDVGCFECTSGGRAGLGTEILKLLDIQEVNR